MERFSDAESARISSALTAHLTAATTKDVALLRSAFTLNAVFVGTDDTEQWSIDQLAQFLEDSEDGWDMTNCIERSIFKIGTSSKAAVFFEVVVHSEYGPMRGSGVVLGDGGGNWRIMHYVLSFSVPNKVVDETDILKLLAS